MPWLLRLDEPCPLLHVGLCQCAQLACAARPGLLIVLLPSFRLVVLLGGPYSQDTLCSSPSTLPTLVV